MAHSADARFRLDAKASLACYSSSRAAPFRITNNSLHYAEHFRPRREENGKLALHLGGQQICCDGDKTTGFFTHASATERAGSSPQRSACLASAALFEETDGRRPKSERPTDRLGRTPSSSASASSSRQEEDKELCHCSKDGAEPHKLWPRQHRRSRARERVRQSPSPTLSVREGSPVVLCRVEQLAPLQ